MAAKRTVGPPHAGFAAQLAIYSARMPCSATKAAALVLSLAGALASCSTAPERPAEAQRPTTPAAPLPALTDVEWRCVELRGADGTTVAVTNEPPTLRIGADGRAAGFAGVNRFGCEARIGNAKAPGAMPLAFGPVMATRMAGPPERMELERAYTAMLASVREAEVSRGAVLVLRSERGVCARFAAGAPSER